jgi:hypothetical protein
MPLQKLVFKPGINKEGTNYTNEGGWFDCDKVRFRSGNAEKIGGWTRLSNSTFVGICRALWNWGTLAGANLLGVGTSKKYYVEQGGIYNDITPLLLNGSGSITTTLGASPLGTTNNSTAVTVTDGVSGISPSVGDYVILTSTAYVGGLSISGEYIITKINNNVQYEITASSAATSTATGGGTVTVQYEYPIGNDVYTVNNGWGAGSWSPTNTTALGSYPFSVTAGSSTITVTQTAHGYLTSAGSFIIGQQYRIVAVGTTNFTLIGASSNTVGVVFTATGAGTGSGTAFIAWVAFSGVTNLIIEPFIYNFSGTIGFKSGNTYGMSGVTTGVSVPANIMNRTFVPTYVNANTYTITLPDANAGSFRTGNTYIITSVGTTNFTAIGASSNTIGVSFVATGPGSGTGTASITALYTVVSGGSSAIVYPEYGIRGWGSAASIGVGSQLRLWTNDNFGQDLVIAPRGGKIYYWQASGTYTNGSSAGVGYRAILLNTLSTAAGYSGQFVPNTTNQILGSAIQRFVIAFGANPYDPTNANTTFDPLLVRWSDQENPYEWVPQATNQSGEYRLNIGSYIVCARSTRQEILIWSDAAIYSMQYLGPPYVWGFQLLQDNISIMGPNASITVNNVTYWMGTDKFYRYTGRVETLSCTLRQYVYQDINQDQNFQVYAGSVEGYNEIWWFYCSANSDQIDRYVIYNYVDDVWYYGNMSRTAWLDSGLRQYPMGADTANFRILYHENGVDDVSGLTSVPIVSYLQSSDFDIGDGMNFGFVWRILPDLTFNGSTSGVPEVTMVVLPRVNSGTAYGMPNAPVVASAQSYASQHTYAVQQFTGQVYTRIRGRQMAFRIESDKLGVDWQIGYPRIDIRPDGRR